MLEQLFLSVLNMSITAAWVIAAILIMRCLIRKLPRRYSYYLWAVAGLRLICPFSIESVFSLFNLKGFSQANAGSQMEYISKEIGYTSQPQINTGLNMIDRAVNNSLPAAVPHASVNPVQIWITVGTILWLAGITAAAVYAVLSAYHTKKMVSQAVLLRDNIFECDNLPSPFVFGIADPKIYIPFRLAEKEQQYILMHEQYHIRRKDHWTRLLAFILLALHWFNPLVWLACVLMNRDMEMSCDEAVLTQLDKNLSVKKEYSTLLLSFGMNRRKIPVGPLAFGESDTASRIKNVLNFHSPKLWMSIVGAGVLIILAVACLTNGSENEGNDLLQNNAQNTNSHIVVEETLASSDDQANSEAAEKASGIPTTAAAQETTETHTYTEKERQELREQYAQMLETEAFIESSLNTWATAFCDRNSQIIPYMCSNEMLSDLQTQELIESPKVFSFGWSSPWPWQSETDYRILSFDDRRAVILYYAQTSDPHVTVWRTTLEYETDGQDFLLTSHDLQYMDAICTGEEYKNAYPSGINGTEMDYLVNGMGEALNQNALLSSGKSYQFLFSPESAAVTLLNLLDNTGKVEIGKRTAVTSGDVLLQIHFILDDTWTEVRMIQPYGENGIWIPQDAEPETELSQTEAAQTRYSTYKEYQKMLGEDFLAIWYDKINSVQTDLLGSSDQVNSADGKVTMEVYTGNIGDGDSGFVLVKNQAGEVIYDEFAHVARAGWNNIYLCENNYLMTVHIEDRDTFGEYSYEVFRLDESGNRIPLEEALFSWMDSDRNDTENDLFIKKLEKHLKESYLLLSTQNGELVTDERSGKSFFQ